MIEDVDEDVGLPPEVFSPWAVVYGEAKYICKKQEWPYVREALVAHLLLMKRGSRDKKYSMDMIREIADEIDSRCR